MKHFETINIECCQKCAFCKYWSDPKNEVVQSDSVGTNVWKYDTKAKRICMRKQKKTLAGESCTNYVCKMLIMKLKKTTEDID